VPRCWPTRRRRRLSARAIVEAAGPGRDRLRDLGFRRASQFTWGATAAATLDVYREVAEHRRYQRT
jgi:glycosyltransferase involved in cell wall biosynthesis